MLKKEPNLTNDIQLESKEKMRARGIRSPDLGDAVALTFASSGHIKDYIEKEVVANYGNPDRKRDKPFQVRPAGGAYGWMA